MAFSCVDFVENALFRSQGDICLPSLLLDRLSMGKRDSDGFFSRRLVCTCRSSDRSYNSTDSSLNIFCWLSIHVVRCDHVVACALSCAYNYSLITALFLATCKAGSSVYRIYSNRSSTLNSSYTWSSVKEIVAACMRNVHYVGVVMITSGPRLLVRCKTMAEDSLGLVLLQHRSFFDNRISITRSEAL